MPPPNDEISSTATRVVVNDNAGFRDGSVVSAPLLDASGVPRRRNVDAGRSFRRQARPNLAAIAVRGFRRAMATVSAVAKPHHAGYGASAKPARVSAPPTRRTRSAELAVSTAHSAAASHGRWPRKNNQDHPVLRAKFTVSAAIRPCRSALRPCSSNVGDRVTRAQRDVRVQRSPDQAIHRWRGLPAGLTRVR